MRQFAKKFLLTLLLLPIFLVIIGYFIAQTTLMADWFSQQLSQHFSYTIKFDRVEHSLFNPFQLTLTNIEITNPSGDNRLTAEKLLLHTSPKMLQTGLLHFPKITIYQGEVHLANLMNISPSISSDLLQLQSVNLTITDPTLPLTGHHLTGGITPWYPSAITQHNSQFQLSANRLEILGITSQYTFIQGQLNNKDLILQNIGADLNYGQFSGRMTRYADGSWLIDKIYLNRFRGQSSETLTKLLNRINTLPNITINTLDLTNATLEGPDWALNDLNISLDHIALQQGQWTGNRGRLAFNAVDIILDEFHLEEPIIKLNIHGQDIALRQFSSRWQKGLLRAKGQWQHVSKHLTLEELTIAGLEYTLPTHWYQKLSQVVPTWLSALTFEQLSIGRNIIVDITPEFPFQLTQLEGYGQHLQLVAQGQIGIWQGELTLHANNATFNQVDLRYPSLALTANPQQITLREISAMTTSGMLEATATIGQNPQHPYAIELQATNISPNILTQWGWQDSLPQPPTDFHLELINNNDQITHTLTIIDQPSVIH